ncbi:unnamed protein product, partial [Dicrocoelium dendriticum]
MSLPVRRDRSFPSPSGEPSVHYYGQSHLTIQSTVKLITNHYTWPSMRSDIRQWAKHCFCYQSGKVHRYVISAPGSFLLPEASFRCVHLNILGPLPPSNNFTFILTCVARFTRWPHAIPLHDVLRNWCLAFFGPWILFFGEPSTISTDGVPQFSSTLFRDLNHFWVVPTFGQLLIIQLRMGLLSISLM